MFNLLANRFVGPTTVTYYPRQTKSLHLTFKMVKTYTNPYTPKPPITAGNLEQVTQLSSGKINQNVLPASTYFGVVLLSSVVFYNDTIHISNAYSCFKIRFLQQNVTLLYCLLWVLFVRPT